MTSGLKPRPAPGAPRPATGAAVAVLLATTAADDGGPAALQPWEGGTILERLAGQLGRLGVGEIHVLTRPGWEFPWPSGPVHVSAGPADDLRLLAGIARDAPGDVVVAHADIVMHDSALANLLARHGSLTGALTTTRTAPAGRFAPRVRERKGRLASAGSPYHSVRDPSGGFLGVLRVAAPDRAALARLADRLAALPPLPAWEAELDRKLRRWRHAVGDDAAALREAAARQDVASLLLCALVRDGVPVAGAHLRRLFWARPLSGAALAKAAERIREYDEDRLVLDSAVKADDTPFTTYLVSPYSRFIARWAARRGLTPNQVTTVAMLLGLVAAAAFATGERWAMVVGAVVLQLSFTADCVDGQLARYTRTFSKLGAWLDSVFDRAKEYAVFAGLAIGAAQSGDDVWLLAGCAMALQTVRHMIFVGYRDTREQQVFAAARLPIEQPSDQPGAGDTLDGEEEAPRRRPLPKRARAVRRRLGRLPAADAVRRMIPAPIGERFAVISVTAALFTPRTTFVVLLAWGAVAAVYTYAGRILRSIAATGSHGRTGALAAYRDDGPLARALGATLGRALPVPEPVLVVVAAVPLLAAIALGGDGVADPVAAAVIAWAVLWGGAASGAPAAGRLRWVLLPILRLAEYAALLWLAALAGSEALPAAFALIAVLAFRHYDLVYRWRLRGTTPPAWVGTLALGWDGRLIAGWVLLAAGALTAGFWVAAAVLGAVFVAEAAALWARGGAEQPDELHDDEEDGEA